MMDDVRHGRPLLWQEIKRTAQEGSPDILASP